MLRVITYGTYDLLHRGHIRLLEQAKALGDYLIVGVTSDAFDKARGKINVQQSLLERIEGVQATGLADEIIIEEYDGQKIDDIKRYEADIFTVGSDWAGKFDYLKEYCKVIYLPRTEGVSSSDIRAEKQMLKIGLVGEGAVLTKYKNECDFVNGVQVAGLCTSDEATKKEAVRQGVFVTEHYEEMLDRVDAVYLFSHPSMHTKQIQSALLRNKHVLCEAPVSLKNKEYNELMTLAKRQGLILMESIKTAYATAYYRLLLLAKSGRIGQIISVDATCTSLGMSEETGAVQMSQMWSSICDWGPVAMLPVFQLLGTEYTEKTITSWLFDKQFRLDRFTKIDFLYPNATASIKVGKGIKSEGELIISGTKGYIYVPAPWWKTDYFEIRYENQSENQRCFYQLEGEGIRYEIVSFVRAVKTGVESAYIAPEVTGAVIGVIEDYYNGKAVRLIGEEDQG